MPNSRGHRCATRSWAPSPLVYADTRLRHPVESTLLRNRAFRVIADRDVQLVHRISGGITSHETLALEA